MTMTEREASGTRLSEKLRTMTSTDHRSAEHAPSMRALLAAKLPLESYVALVVQHYFVYEELEAAAESQRTDPVGGRFVFDELTRLPALEVDLLALMGPDWRDRITPLPSTVTYCDRMREVCHTDAPSFVAHHYTRYLGDLSGGQMIRRVANRMYDLQGGGAKFYDFDHIGDLTAWKDRYRALLDEAPWGPEEQDRVIEETRRSYKLNTDLLYELPGD